MASTRNVEGLISRASTLDVRAISSALGVVTALAVVAFVVFAWVVFQELSYASSHPYAYGPGRVIALGAGGGALLSAAVAVLARALLKALR